MKKGLLMLVLISVISFSAYAMGGAPQNDEFAQNDTPKENVQDSTSANRVDEVSKARAEYKSLKSDLDKVQSYLWVLDGKIIAARKAKDMTRLADLKDEEQLNLDRARGIKEMMKVVKKTYPELIVSEEESAQVETQNTQIQIDNIAVEPAKPALNQAQKIEQKDKNIIFYTVRPKDTLMSISRKYYGTPSMYKEIVRLNNLTSGLRVGMKLKIDLRLKNMAPAAVPSPETKEAL